jgi:hypothetical protein
LARADEKKIYLIFQLPYFSRRFFLIFLLSSGVYCYSQKAHGDMQVTLPDTNLSLERSLLLLEEKTDLYFSYNPEILDLEDEFLWQQGVHTLENILQVIKEQQDLNYTIIGNQVVFYLPGAEPGLVIPIEERDPDQIRKIWFRESCRSLTGSFLLL